MKKILPISALVITQVLSSFSVAQESGNKGMADDVTAFAQQNGRVLIGAAGDLAALYYIKKGLFSDKELSNLLARKKQLKSQMSRTNSIISYESKELSLSERASRASDKISATANSKVATIPEIEKQIESISTEIETLSSNLKRTIETYVFEHHSAYKSAVQVHAENVKAFNKLIENIGHDSSKYTPEFTTLRNNAHKAVLDAENAVNILKREILTNIENALIDNQLPKQYSNMLLDPKNLKRDIARISELSRELDIAESILAKKRNLLPVAQQQAKIHGKNTGLAQNSATRLQSAVADRQEIEALLKETEAHIIVRRTQLGHTWFKRQLFKAVKLVGFAVVVLDIYGKYHMIVDFNRDPGLLALDDLYEDGFFGN